MDSIYSDPELRKLIELAIKPPVRDKKCPRCGKAFYAYHLNRKFCTDYCADAYYNEIRRPAKQILTELAQRDKEEKERQAYKDSLPLPENILRRNIAILDKLIIEPFAGTAYQISDLQALGLDFSVFSYKERLVGKAEECYALFFGTYKVTQLDEKRIKIRNRKK
jgi:ribosomal protein S27AE